MHSDDSAAIADGEGTSAHCDTGASATAVVFVRRIRHEPQIEVLLGVHSRGQRSIENGCRHVAATVHIHDGEGGSR